MGCATEAVVSEGVVAAVQERAGVAAAVVAAGWATAAVAAADRAVVTREVVARGPLQSLRAAPA